VIGTLYQHFSNQSFNQQQDANIYEDETSHTSPMLCEVSDEKYCKGMMSPDEYSEWLTHYSYYKDKFQKKKNAERAQINRQSSRVIRSTKKKSKARRKRAKKVQAHFIGNIGVAYIKQCVIDAGLQSSEKLLDAIENIALLYSGIENAANNLGVFTALLVYLKTHVKGSIFFKLRDLITKILTEPETGDVEAHSSGTQDEPSTEVDIENPDGVKIKTNTGFQWNDKPEWLVKLRDFRVNWTQMRDSLFTDKLSKLLGLVVITGLCDEETVKFDIAGFELISADLNVVHKKASSVIDAVFDTVIYFVEVGYACWKHGSLNPIWTGMEDVSMDQRISDIKRWWNSCAVGNLKRDFDMTDRQFCEKLEDAILELERRKALISRGLAHITLVKLHAQLMDIHNNFVDLKVSGGTRKSPFLICFYGGTGQSKSFITEQMTRALLTSAGVNADERLWYTKNPLDDYWSGFRSDMTTVNWDDFCQGAADKSTHNPWMDVFGLKGNQKFVANMADVESKGRVYGEPELLTMNTNSEWMQVKTWVTSPSAALRRIDYRIVTKTKAEFSKTGEVGGMLDKSAALLWRKEHPDEPIDDIWECTVQYFKPKENASISALPDVKIARHWGKPLENVSAKEALAFLTEQFLLHNEEQTTLMENKKNIAKCLEVCGVDGCRQLRGVCNCIRPEKVDAHTYLGDALCKVAGGAAARYLDVFNGVDYAASKLLLHQAERFWRNNGWYALLPTSWAKNPTFQKLMMITNRRTMMQHYMKQSMWNLIWGVASAAPLMYAARFKLLPPRQIGLISSGVITYTAMRQMSIAEYAKESFVEELIETNESVSVVSLEQRDQIAKTLLTSSAMVMAAYTLVKFIRNCKDSVTLISGHGFEPEEEKIESEPQGNLTPTSESEIRARELESDQWAKAKVQRLPVNEDTATMTIEQVMNAVGKSLYHCKFVDHGTFVNALFLDTNICILPNHVFEVEGRNVEDIKCFFSKHGPNVTGGSFTYLVSKSATYHIPGTDLRVVYVGGGGDHTNIMHLFPQEGLTNGSTFHGRIRFRNNEGKFLDGKIHPEVARVGHAHCTDFKGGKYSAKTFSGLCGSPVFSDSKTKQIVGVHLGGVANIQYGIYGEITQTMLRNAIAQLRKTPGVRLGGSSGTFRNHILGRDIVVSAHGPEPRSPMNFLPQGTQLEYYGQCIGKTTPRSDVCKTKISSYVFDVMDYANQWGKPSMKPAWKPYQTCMANISEPALNFEHTALIWAIEDYTLPIYQIFKKPQWHCGPLSHHETLNGIAGSKFVKSMDFSTSIGYPLTGPKSKYSTLHVDEKGNEYREFDDFILQHLKEVGEVYERGERFYAVCNGCTKNEAVPLGKDKCRIFYANPISLVYYVRKYFLPIARVFMLNPIVCECAVGINSHGPEWEELDDHRKKYPNIFGGDYSKYDQNIPSQLVNAALQILIECAKLAGYTEKDIRIMEAISSDIVYAMVNFNGDLVRLLIGAMISGNSLTVIINGIEGSLNLRVAYYYLVVLPHREKNSMVAMLDRSKEHFRKNVSLITYGDDNDGSVTNAVADQFNIKTVSEFLAKYGQKYTMPDKSTTLRPFLTVDESDFLCRKTNYIPEINTRIGALAEDSIFKSLHVHTYGKKETLTREEKVCAAAESAMIEWFNHGRETYERRRAQLKEVMNRAELINYCDFLNETFDDRVEKWIRTYRS
jgi:hypothetical protein